MANEIHTLAPAPGSTHRRKRLGRGIGSGHGKTSTKGHKGNKARGNVNPNFEGGQTPLHRRLPQLRGFRPVNKKVYALVNIGLLNTEFEAGQTVTPDLLMQMGILRDLHHGLKVLGTGEITRPLTVHTHHISEGAKTKIEEAGGSVVLLGNA